MHKARARRRSRPCCSAWQSAIRRRFARSTNSSLAGSMHSSCTVFNMNHSPRKLCPIRSCMCGSRRRVFAASRAFSTWLLGVARFKMLERLRQRKPESDETSTRSTRTCWSRRPARRMLPRCASAAKACASVSTCCRPSSASACTLRTTKAGRSMRSASIMSLKKETVGTRLFYARKKIQACLAALLARERGPTGGASMSPQFDEISRKAAAGTLSAAEREWLDAHLREHPEQARRARMGRGLQREARGQDRSDAGPARLGAHRALLQAEAEQAGAAAAAQNRRPARGPKTARRASPARSIACRIGSRPPSASQSMRKRSPSHWCSCRRA